MNHQLIFKKLALSAVLVSAIAAPTVTNAASNAPKATTPEVLFNVVSTPATNVLATFTSVASRWANPLELATTYAPNTLEDWKKTLEQYKVVAGETNNMELSIDMGTAGIKLDEAFEVNFEDMTAVEGMIATPIVAGETNNMEFFINMDTAGIKPAEAFEINFEDMSAVESTIASAVQISEADQAFIKAQIALNDAAESKDATAIKEALVQLLEQYKLQIVDLETAK